MTLWSGSSCACCSAARARDPVRPSPSALASPAPHARVPCADRGASAPTHLFLAHGWRYLAAADAAGGGRARAGSMPPTALPATILHAFHGVPFACRPLCAAAAARPASVRQAAAGASASAEHACVPTAVPSPFFFPAAAARRCVAMPERPRPSPGAVAGAACAGAGCRASRRGRAQGTGRHAGARWPTHTAKEEEISRVTSLGASVELACLTWRRSTHARMRPTTCSHATPRAGACSDRRRVRTRRREAQRMYVYGMGIDGRCTHAWRDGCGRAVASPATCREVAPSSCAHQK